MTLTIISLHGPTGCGKDTLARMICDRAIGKVSHLKFADQLRKDTEDWLIAEGLTTRHFFDLFKDLGGRDQWERQHLSDGKSFKHYMIEVARLHCATEPYRYVDAFIKAVSKARGGEPNPSIVVSDCRKPIEFAALRGLTDRLYCFRINRHNNPVPPKLLDGLLAHVKMPLLTNDEGQEEALYDQYCEAMQMMPPWPMWKPSLTDEDYELIYKQSNQAL